MKTALLQKLRHSAGFTMIELLVVIAILGVLAVVVLGTINPLEQINRGRDTAARADAEAIIGAIERFNANLGRFPWENPADDATYDVDVVTDIDDGWNDPIAVCPVINSLGQGVEPAVATCPGTQEVKSSLVERILGLVGDRIPVVYFRGTTNGDSVYVCFNPQSDSFRQQAIERCGGTLPVDYPTAATVCAEGDEMVCLP